MPNWSIDTREMPKPGDAFFLSADCHLNPNLLRAAINATRLTTAAKIM
jgi:hypothetical protein